MLRWLYDAVVDDVTSVGGGREDDDPGPGLDGALVVGVVLLTLLHWVTLALRLPLAQSLPGWFLGYSSLPFGSVWPIPVLGVATIAGGWFVFRRSESTKTVLILLIGLGFVLQVGLSALEGRGLDALRDPLVRVGGHGEMIEVSIAEPSMFDVIRNYEAYAASDRLMHYAQSKPPGFVLTYMVTERMASFLGAATGAEARHAWAATVAAVSWSLVSFLVVLPLFWFSRLYMDARDAAVVCLLYLVVPSVQLISGHLDQVLFPLLAMLIIAMAAQGQRHGSRALVAGAGAVCALSVFMSFSLLPVIPLVAVVVAAEAFRKACGVERWKALAMTGLVFAAGAVVVQLAFALIFDYDPLTRFRNAMVYHANWKSLPFDLRTVAYTSILNLIEFGTWLGVPISVAWMCGSLAGLSHFLRREEQTMDRLMVGTALVVLLMCVFGRTLAEVARLWMFLVPLVCFFAVAAISKHLRSDATRGLAGAIALQAITVLLLKRFCDI